MISLFKKLKEAGKISEALLVGRNIFNRNPGNADVFDEYFSYLCTLAETLPSLADRTEFANQASIVLSYFIENTDITEDKIADILTYQMRLSTIFSELEKTQQNLAEKELNERLQHNSKSLVELYTLKDKMQALSNQKELDEILSRIRQIDATIDKEILSTTRRLLNRLPGPSISSAVMKANIVNRLSYSPLCLQAYLHMMPLVYSMKR